MVLDVATLAMWSSPRFLNGFSWTTLLKRLFIQVAGAPFPSTFFPPTPALAINHLLQVEKCLTGEWSVSVHLIKEFPSLWRCVKVAPAWVIAPYRIVLEQPMTKPLWSFLMKYKIGSVILCLLRVLRHISGCSGVEHWLCATTDELGDDPAVADKCVTDLIQTFI